MLLIYETFTKIAFVGHAQHVRHQKRIKSNHTFILINTCNIINTHQRNKPVENWYGVKCHQLNRIIKK